MQAFFVVALVLTWVLVAILGIALFALYHHFGEMYLFSEDSKQKQGPTIGTQPPAISAKTLAGDELTFPKPGTASLVAFLSIDCQVCDRVRDEVLSFREAHRDVALVAVCMGKRSEVEQWWPAGAERSISIIADRGARIAGAYRVALTPFVVSISSYGSVHYKSNVNDRAGLEIARDLALEAPEADVPIDAEKSLLVTGGR